MDSDDEIFLTQSKTRLDLDSCDDEVGPEGILNEIMKGSVVCSEIQQKKQTNGPYGVEFSDVSEDDELISATQEAEQDYEKRFGQPVSEAEVLLKSRKRQVILYDSNNIYTLYAKQNNI
jgi:hypothetical protein